MSFFRASADLAKTTFNDILEDDCLGMSAAIAYYALFSLAPLLVVVVAVAGAVFGADAVQEQITGQFGGLIGAEGAAQIETMIRNASDLGGGSLAGKAIGLFALLFGATTVFAQLQASLNRAWEVKPDPTAGIKGFIMKRVLSFGLVLTLAFLLLVSLAVSALLALLFTEIEAIVGPAGAWAAAAVNIVVSLAIFTALFATMFKVLPDARIAWSDVWVGALVTAILFTIGRTVIGLYLGQSDVGAAFGAAGSVVVILVWIYYTAFLLLAGAEFTQAWAQRYGSHIEPEEGAVHVVEQEKLVRPTGETVAVKSDAEPVVPAPPAAGGPEPSAQEPRGDEHPWVEGLDPNPRSSRTPEA